MDRHLGDRGAAQGGDPGQVLRVVLGFVPGRFQAPLDRLGDDLGDAGAGDAGVHRLGLRFGALRVRDGGLGGGAPQVQGGHVLGVGVGVGLRAGRGHLGAVRGLRGGAVCACGGCLCQADRRGHRHHGHPRPRRGGGEHRSDPPLRFAGPDGLGARGRGGSPVEAPHGASRRGPAGRGEGPGCR